MGQMRFKAPTPEMLLPHAVDLAYIAGLEAIPWHSTNSLVGNLLTIDRSISESGNLYFPWSVPEIGERVLSTCTLMERDEPYCLATELARGTLHRARSLVAEMESQERAIPDTVQDTLRQALVKLFAATTATTTALQSAHESIRLASQAIEALTIQDTNDALSEVTSGGGELSMILIGPISDSSIPDELTDPYTAAFQAVNTPFRWSQCQPTATDFDWSQAESQLEWSQSHGLRIIGGPLIQLDHLSSPKWTYALEDSYEQFESAAIHYVRSAVERFQDQVDIWVCAGRLNVPGAIAFSEEQKLRLAVATLEAVRSVASRTPVVISFDQPWAEYLAAEDFDLSPLHFADALVRADLGVAGVGLELNLGYWPGGTQPRDLLAISRHLDRWSLLGIPLIVFLTLPSQMGDDARAQGLAEVIPHSPGLPGQPAVSQEMTDDLVRLLLTKPALHGIIWNQWSDADPHEFPYAGLIDADGLPKPSLKTLARIRQLYLS